MCSLRRGLLGRADPGFTLIELIMAVFVLGLISSLVVLGVSPLRDRALESSCGDELAVVRSAANAFEVQHERYPTSIAELVSRGYLKDYPEGTSAASDGAFVFVTDSPPTTVTRPC